MEIDKIHAMPVFDDNAPNSRVPGNGKHIHMTDRVWRGSYPVV